jgi:hypothetical protein
MRVYLQRLCLCLAQIQLQCFEIGGVGRALSPVLCWHLAFGALAEVFVLVPAGITDSHKDNRLAKQL